MTTLTEMSRPVPAPATAPSPPRPAPARPQPKTSAAARAEFVNLLATLPYQPDDFDVDARRVAKIVHEVPFCRIAEKVRKLRTRLKQATLDATRTLLVTSTTVAEGKTVVAGNLAAALALDGRRILLVDANFARPSLHRLFGRLHAPGFTEVLRNPGYFDAFVAQTDLLGLSLLTCGDVAGFSMEWLLPEMVLPFTSRALESFDHVIFDTAPLLSAPTIAMARLADGVITVVKAHSGDVDVMKRLGTTIRQYHLNHLGTVLNGVRQPTGAGNRPAGSLNDGQAA